MFLPARNNLCFELSAHVLKSVVLVRIAWGGIPVVIETLKCGQPFRLGSAFGGIEELASGLPIGAEIELVRGELRFDVAKIAIDPRFSRNSWALDALVLAGFLLVLSIAALAIDRARLLTLPELTFEERPLGVSAQPRVVTSAEPEKAPIFPPVVADVTSELEDSGSARCGCSEMGRADAVTKGRYGVKGPADNPDPHLARARSNGKGSITPFENPSARVAGPEPNTPTAPWGREHALGTDPESERGALWAELIAGARGAEGLGLDHVVSGRTKRIVSTPLGAHPRVLHTGLAVQGGLRPSAISRAMAARFEGFESCYRTRSSELPALGGRVELRFELDASGRLASLSVDSTELHDGPLLACLRKNVQNVSFPPSEQGSTWVVYPLFFSMTGDR